MCSHLVVQTYGQIRATKTKHVRSKFTHSVLQIIIIQIIVMSDRT